MRNSLITKSERLPDDLEISPWETEQPNHHHHDMLITENFHSKESANFYENSYTTLPIDKYFPSIHQSSNHTIENSFAKTNPSTKFAREGLAKRTSLDLCVMLGPLPKLQERIELKKSPEVNYVRKSIDSTNSSQKKAFIIKREKKLQDLSQNLRKRAESENIFKDEIIDENEKKVEDMISNKKLEFSQLKFKTLKENIFSSPVIKAATIKPSRNIGKMKLLLFDFYSLKNNDIIKGVDTQTKSYGKSLETDSGGSLKIGASGCSMKILPPQTRKADANSKTDKDLKQALGVKSFFSPINKITPRLKSARSSSNQIFSSTDSPLPSLEKLLELPKQGNLSPNSLLLECNRSKMHPKVNKSVKKMVTKKEGKASKSDNWSDLMKIFMKSKALQGN